MAKWLVGFREVCRCGEGSVCILEVCADILAAGEGKAIHRFFKEYRDGAFDEIGWSHDYVAGYFIGSCGEIREIRKELERRGWRWLTVL